ncbi:WYL domain-containing protein [Chishuiella sp.]|uniref:WYL domain-containing protein n=1 Tax=Chishuiella sp. TaxID=1969467 RepID=UPI0028AEC198|nr:WYL domain-containing protein [Chishuiella sp.]
MRKTIPTIRIIQVVQYINECNVKRILPLKKDIISHIKNQFPDEIYNVQQFDRDKLKIREELGIDLKCNKKYQYYIDSSDQVGLLESSLDYYEMFSILTQANALPDIFWISDRKSLGLNQISNVVSHINNKHVIQFSYSKYDTNETEVRTIEPLAIKESKERWYIIGNDHKLDKGLRAFGFDRISAVTYFGINFSPKYTLNEIKAKYDSLFAMFDAENKEVEEIILEFDQRDGNYIKSFPIHHSQMIEKTENGVRVTLKLKTTPDFIMEIMSRAWSLNVVKPVSLRHEVSKILKDAYLRNQ